MAAVSQKLASRVVLPYKSIHNNRDIFCGKMVLIFFMNTIAKPHVIRLSVANKAPALHFKITVLQKKLPAKLNRTKMVPTKSLHNLAKFSISSKDLMIFVG